MELMFVSTIQEDGLQTRYTDLEITDKKWSKFKEKKHLTARVPSAVKKQGHERHEFCSTNASQAMLVTFAPQ